MKKIASYILLSGCLALASCSLTDPGETINPNVDEKQFLNSDNAMQSWVNGTLKTFATDMGNYVELMEIMSDDYFNNYSRSSKVFDVPQILYTDRDVTNMQRYVAQFREMADYGLTTVAAKQAPTAEQSFTLTWVKAYGYLLAGENFRALPVTANGEVVEWQGQLRLALSTAAQAEQLATTADEKAFALTLRARAYRQLGNADSALIVALQALAQSADFVQQAKYDGVNGVNNSIQEYIWGTAFQPLPRLDFLDPKYFQTTATEQRPICIGKAEEDHLIIAEALVAQGKLAEAKAQLQQLLTLVQGRPVQHDLNDQLEGRFNGGYKKYPNSSDYRVRASANDPLRSGLILDRQAPNLISVPYISGTSVTASMISDLQSADQALELIYLMRQEIFMAEGRRVADLGIRLPVCETEAVGNASAQPYLEALIPDYIPLNQGMDEFTIDEATKTVTITYNMNRVLVEHKATAFAK